MADPVRPSDDVPHEGGDVPEDQVLMRLGIVGARLVIAVEIFCVLAVVVGLVAGYRPVVLTTDSMAPAAPAGSLLFVSDADASDVAVGDVIVMDRRNGTTVTHRVVALRTVNGQPVATTQGDANATPDPDPYPIPETQPTLRWAVPGLGRLLLPLVGGNWAAKGLLLGAVIVFVVGLDLVRSSLRPQPELSDPDPDPDLDPARAEWSEGTY